MTPSFVVATRTHGLIPVARRLRASGCEVHLLVSEPEYHSTVDGGLAGGTTPEDLQWAVSQVEQGATLVTDLPELWVPFGNVPGRRYGVLGWSEPPRSTLRLGGWFTGSQLVNPHVLIADVGPWTGGAGDPSQLGGATLVIPDPRADLTLFGRLWDRLLTELKALDFRGLIQAGVDVDETGYPELRGLTAGWPWLHTHAWLSELDNLPGVLAGTEEPRIDPWEHRWVTALPVSIPPWPNPSTREAAPEHPAIEGLTPQQSAQVLWHDVRVDTGRRAVVPARRDGLLGVARGAAHTLELSRARALEIALAVRVEGKQLRSDVGSQCGPLLAALEAGYGVRL